MKVFVGIWLAFVAVTSAAAGEDGDNSNSCVDIVNNLAKDIDYPEPINGLVSKLESVLDLQRVVELEMGPNSDTHSEALAYTVAVPNVPECEAFLKKSDEIMPKADCMQESHLSYDQFRHMLMSGNFGKFLRSYFACAIVQGKDSLDDE